MKPRKPAASLPLTLLAGLVLTAGLVAVNGAPPASQRPVIEPIGIEVIGQTELLAGSHAAVRAILTDHRTGNPVKGGRIVVRISPADKDEYTTLVRGLTDGLGTADASFTVPDVEPGDYDLKVTGRAASGSDETVQRARISRRYQVLLTTDKPIYQPGQTMHIRALALKQPNLAAVANREATLEVKDAKGNKVFKKRLATDDYGIVSTDFILADEVNMGRYALGCIVDGQETEKTVTVERYVLPKFDLDVSTNRQYYLPGETVEGTVQVDYFYGVPVRGGKVEISVKTFDVEYTEIATIEGTTDASGTFAFETKLPDSFVGQPVEQGDAFLQFDVKVTNRAGHPEKSTHTSTVAKDPIRIDVIAESGEIVPGVENVLYVLTSYPDGSPAECYVRMTGLHDGGDSPRFRAAVRTADELGLTEWTITPTTSDVTVDLSARTEAGETANRSVTLDSSGATEGVLLRLNSHLAGVGDTIKASVLASGGIGAVYVDVIKNRQTMLTKAADVKDGRATVSIPLTADLTGSIWLNAYRIQPTGDILRDTAPVFVDPASDLSIDISSDEETYKPGEDAEIQFAVRNSEGEPVAAALGINVVDESVFALQELKPGMEKVYFYLEQELMKPRVEIHEFEMPIIIARQPLDRPMANKRDRAAKVLLAGAEMPEASGYHVNTYADRVEKLKSEWAQELQPKLEKLQQAIQKYQQKHNGRTFKAKLGAKPLLDAKLIAAEDLQDQWGQDFVIVEQGDGEQDVWMLVLQAIGPDGRPDTADDMFVQTSWPGAWGMDEDFQQGFFGGGGGMMGAGMGEGGGVRMRGGAVAMPMMEMAMAPMDALAEPVAFLDDNALMARDGGGPNPVRIRKYFPETMFSEPALITDGDGKATLSLKMADSITTWRMTAMANSAKGELGSTTSGLRCFQDFFADIDLPVSLTRNDEVSIPVMVFNHLDQAQSVRLELTEADWFALDGDAKRTLEIGAKDEAAIYFTITAKEIGSHPLTVHAYGDKLSDAIERRIEIRPDGQETLATVNDRIDDDVTQTISIPRQAIDGASDIMVKIYSGIFSQAVEGLDSVLQMPSGCFEQTSSATYPNILVLDYMKTTGQVTPEIRMKAEGFINTGYQRLVSFEVAGGGYSWFGEAPANKILTAYGVMEFQAMSDVYEVDPDVITRTAEWLFSQQQEDGSWKPDEAYLHQESWGRIQNNSLLPTAYIAWALGKVAPDDARLGKAVSYLKKHADEAKDAYTLALVCNALVANATDAAETQEQLSRLVKMAKREDGKMWWESEITGITHSSGKSSDLEATGLAALALIDSGTHPGDATEVLNYLIAEKDPRGTWYSTQATILALRALLGAQKDSTQKVNAELSILCNGEHVKGLAIDEDNSDVVHFVSLKQHVREGDNEVQIKFDGEGTSLYQMTSKYYLPWKGAGGESRDAVSIDIEYDKTELAVDDIVTANVTIANQTPGRMGMVLVDLGIPPGFKVQPGDLAELVGSKVIQKYTLTGRQIIVYIEEMEAGKKVELTYRLRAKFPIKAKTPDSTAYEYYNPDNRGVAEPVDLVVEAH